MQLHAIHVVVGVALGGVRGAIEIVGEQMKCALVQAHIACGMKTVFQKPSWLAGVIAAFDIVVMHWMMSVRPVCPFPTWSTGSLPSKMSCSRIRHMGVALLRHRKARRHY